MTSRISPADLEKLLKEMEGYSPNPEKIKKEIRSSLFDAYAEADEAVVLRARLNTYIEQKVDLESEIRRLSTELNRLELLLPPTTVGF